MTTASGTAELALATRGLVKRYGSRTALDGLDLTVPSGVVYGFLGPNGAGKTTTMRLLTGLLHPDAGTVGCSAGPSGAATASACSTSAPSSSRRRSTPTCRVGRTCAHWAAPARP